MLDIDPMGVRTQEVYIGNKKFLVEELSCVSRRVLTECIGKLTLPGVMKHLLESLNSDSNKENEDNLEAGATSLFSIIGDSAMWDSLVDALLEGTDLLTTAITLSIKSVCDEPVPIVKADTENLIAAKAKSIKKDTWRGVEDKDAEYIREFITMRQEAHILVILKEINSMEQVLKNYRGLTKGLSLVKQMMNPKKSTK